TLKDYIRKRRLSLSAYDLIYTEDGILHIAVKYGYSTYESYSRAFKKLYGIAPAHYRKKASYIEIFPGVQMLKTVQSKVEENKMVIDKLMNQDLVKKKLDGNKSGYILDIDIDKFENINARYGYSVGDKVLVALPTAIETYLKSVDIVNELIRINNDEFALIIREDALPQKMNIKALASGIVNLMNSPLKIGELQVDLSISIGIAKFTTNEEETAPVENANMAMFEAKKAGRNTFRLYGEPE
ncbi:Transcription regulator HTH, AraC- type like protein, partial [Aduncisulcus paluster]